MNQTRHMHQSRLAAFATSAAFLAVLAGCATEAPKTEAPAPVPVAAPAPPPAPVVTPTPPPAPPKALARPDATAVFFDFDRDNIRDDAIPTVRAHAEYLMQSGTRVELGGNADERGSRDYNMALGQKRADAVKRALTALGVKADRIDTISFGEDKPRAKGHDEASWAENRRVDFAPAAK